MFQKQQRKKKLEIRLKIWNYFHTHPCVDCGETDPFVLEFDHVDRKSKIEAVSTLVSRHFSWKMILSEIEKCEIRCANCHKRKTAKQMGYYKGLC